MRFENIILIPVAISILLLTSIAQAENRTENKALLGIVTAPAKKGVHILHVLEDSPADKAGLKAGDLLIKIGKRKIFKTTDVDSALSKLQPDEIVKITVKRKGKSGTKIIKMIDRKKYKGKFLRSQSSGKTGFKAPDWYGYAWENLGGKKEPPTLLNSRGKVAVIHAFQSW